MEKAFVVGLTGQTGAGKSTVSKWFEESGFVRMDADLCAREVTERGFPCLREIVRTFGDSILNPDGTLNRAALGKIVFRDPQKLKTLNAITHPYIIANIEEKIKRHAGQRILLDAPTLFESGADRLCDCIVYLRARKEARLARIIRRDTLSEQDAAARINAQHPDAFYLEKSDYVLENDSTLEQLHAETERLIDTLIRGGVAP